MLASGSQDSFVRLWKITSKSETKDESEDSVTLETQSFQAYLKGINTLKIISNIKTY